LVWNLLASNAPFTRDDLTTIFVWNFHLPANKKRKKLEIIYKHKWNFSHKLKKNVSILLIGLSNIKNLLPYIFNVQSHTLILGKNIIYVPLKRYRQANSEQVYSKWGQGKSTYTFSAERQLSAFRSP
jgi:hypothetical protein